MTPNTEISNTNTINDDYDCNKLDELIHSLYLKGKTESSKDLKLTTSCSTFSERTKACESYLTIKKNMMLVYHHGPSI